MLVLESLNGLAENIELGIPQGYVVLGDTSPPKSKLRLRTVHDNEGSLEVQNSCTSLI